MTQAPSIKETLEQIVAIDQIQRQICVDADPAGNTYALEEVDGACAKIARAALATFQPSGERREAIARIIDPAAFGHVTGRETASWRAWNDSRNALALKTADRIIASGLVQDEAGWRDISTAPKDGTAIFVRRDNGCGTDYMVVWWNDTNNDGYPWQSDNNAYVEDRWDEWMLPPTRSARNGGAS